MRLIVSGGEKGNQAFRKRMQGTIFQTAPETYLLIFPGMDELDESLNELLFIQPLWGGGGT